MQHKLLQTRLTVWTVKSPLRVINKPEGTKEPQLKIVL